MEGEGHVAVVPATDAGQRFVALCEGTALGARVTVDFVTAAWRKLCVNVAGGAVTAVTGRTLGVLRRPAVAEVARGLIRECIEVGRAEVAVLEDELVDEIVDDMIRGPEEASTSIRYQHPVERGAHRATGGNAGDAELGREGG